MPKVLRNWKDIFAQSTEDCMVRCTWFLTPLVKPPSQAPVASVLYASVKLLLIVHFPP